ncbi:YraN family protein [Compostimonas suwonensis]|uniref:UPF0102 protein CLV54_1264 n=1 Tax=Compostimonas suwonensis TaxID=1048394 RepID=A0A2M9BZV2_9MICO|nr:YraN family protein [Compostimonas suwonensis]PJJ63594.1 putative endonuclease [Compostimonas suwonensis]
MAAKDELGRRGEELAGEYLAERGYTIRDRNWRCALGEIDIVAERAGVTVVVEVKTRTSVDFGHPFAAITPVKVARLRRLAAAWCDAHGGPRPLRVDAVAIVAPRNARPVIEHLEGIS